MSDIRKGVYILPNLLTSASLLCGFYSIIHALRFAIGENADLERCAVALILAAIFDGLDGRVARKTGTTSKFGMEYDSLSDLVSFGVAPAFLMYVWALQDFGRIGWLACFLYVACGALRLARFNVKAGIREKHFFEGLPIPMAAMIIACAVMIWEGTSIQTVEIGNVLDVRIFLLSLVYLLAGLMVSSLPYRSFKSFNLTGRNPFQALVLTVLFFVLILAKPWWMLFLFGCLYLISAPIERFLLPFPIRFFRKARKKRNVSQSLRRIDDISNSRRKNG